MSDSKDKKLNLKSYAAETSKYWEDLLMSPSPMQDQSLGNRAKFGYFNSELSPRQKFELLLPKMFKIALKKSLRSLLHAYGARVTINVLLVVLSRIFSKKSSAKESIFKLITSQFTKKEPVRFGLFMGSFTFIWKIVFPLLQVYNTEKVKVTRYISGSSNCDDPETVQRRINRLNGFIAGSLAGLSLLFEENGKFKLFGHQAAVRAVQCLYNASKQRQFVHLPYGDSVLFAVATAQILYAYSMHPQTLPKDFYGFMIQSAKLPPVILKAFRDSSNQIPIDLESVQQYIYKKYPYNQQVINFVKNKIQRNVNHIPCDIVHPDYQSCSHYSFHLWSHVFKQILPVYVPLNLVPLILFKAKSLVKDPMPILQKGILSSVRSSVFFAALVSSYQSIVCFHGKLFQQFQIPIFDSLFGPLLNRDHRYYYFAFGLLSGATILIESKSRRSELAMYVAPKAIESFYRILYKRNRIFKIKGFQTALHCVSFGILMSFYITEGDVLSPFFHRILKYFIGDGSFDKKKQIN